VIFVGLPLLGWGVKDVHGFISHPARLIYTVLSVVLQVVVVIKIPGIGRSCGKGEKSVPRQRLAVALMQVISLAIVIAAPYSDRREIAVLSEGEIVRYLGLSMYALGIIAMHWAEAFLGKQFSIEISIQEGHRLVTDGPYRYLRHPRYLGVIIFITGISLVYRSWLALILVAAMTLVLIWRIHDEEALLHQEFGTEWEAYSKRSWRLIPFVY
jgi:protein-S-isoprenylcysteine O-methyltransferase Ste14